jgi:tetratricopeptide (TPR) repeat protein
MRTRNWREVALDDGAILERIEDDDRVVLWVFEGRKDGFLYWDRISTSPRAEITTQAGLCSTSASSIGTRQPARGLLGKFLPRLQRARSDRAWTMPNGEVTEQFGPRRTDLALVWAEDDATVLDETEVGSRRPAAQRVRKIGKNLFIVFGLETNQRPGDEREPPLGTPRQEAERMLDVARRKGDRKAEASALADLAITIGTEGDQQRSAVLLREALNLVRLVGDLPREADVLGNLGLALLHVEPNSPQALELFEQELSLARETGDRFAEKTALVHLSTAHGQKGDRTECLRLLEQALSIAREVGDLQHQADLLWVEAVAYADIGNRQGALARGEASIAVLQSMGKPGAEWYAEHLRRFRDGGTGYGLHEPPPSAKGPSQPADVAGPGLLRMAASATGAMARFLGSGMKTTPPEVAKQRRQTCNACEHHTGVRCRVCGCFTQIKSMMLHERCPLGKWPG